MKFLGKTHIIISIITFAILFAMNYFGNDLPDKLERALLTAIAGVVGLSVGVFVLYKAGKKDGNDKFPNFD